MNQNSKTVNVYFLPSDKSPGISSLIYRMLFNKFTENIPDKKNQYQFKILEGKNYITLNFWKIKDDIDKLMSSLDPINENIILFVYNVSKYDPSKEFSTIHNNIITYLTTIKKDVKLKLGLVGNKLDKINLNLLNEVIPKVEEYSKKINAKPILISAQEGKGDLFQFIIGTLNSKLIKSKKSLIEEYKKQIKSKKTELLSDIHRCEICKTKILIAKFHENLNRIEYNCKENHNHDCFSLYSDENDYKRSDLCDLCKNKNKIFCKMCKKLICKDCGENHEHKTDQDIIRPYYGEDQLCEIHGMKNNICCLNCKSLICSFCSNIYHSGHKVDDNIDKIIEEIINEKKKLIEGVKEKLELFNKFYSDLIKTLDQLYKNFVKKINLDLKLKNKFLDKFNVIKYNNEYYNTILQMNFNELEKNIQKDYESTTIFNKLQIFFDYIGQPINIKELNLCNQDKKIENKIKEYDLNNKNILNDNFNYRLTDACSIGKDHCCLSFNDGSIKVYKNDDMKEEKSFCLLYDKEKGVNSLLNYNNTNILFASGQKIIYQLKINDDLSIDKIYLQNLEGTNYNYSKLCSYTFKNSILYIEEYTQNMGIYNIFNGEKCDISSINSDNNNLEINYIIDLVNINRNIFYMKYINNKFNINFDKNSNNKGLELTKDYTLELVKGESSNSDMNFSSNNIKRISDIKNDGPKIYKIFYIDEKGKMYNENILDNSKILGIVDNQHLVVQGIDKHKKIKYKIYNFEKKEEKYFGSLLNEKNLNFKLVGQNQLNGKIYFALISPNCNISEFAFIPSKNIIEEIGMFENNNININNNPIIKSLLFQATFMIFKDDKIYEISC